MKKNKCKKEIKVEVKRETEIAEKTGLRAEEAADENEEKSIEVNFEDEMLKRQRLERARIKQQDGFEFKTKNKQRKIDLAIKEPQKSEDTGKINEDFEIESEAVEEESMKENFEDIQMNIEEEKKEQTSEGGNGGNFGNGGVYGGGSGILFKPLEEVLHDSMIPYTEHVVLDRALPRVEDGLKPVQRRILYSMLELGLTPDKPYRKSARIVGDCMGKYHPHGDSSVYDAMVRMSQDFILRAPLVDGHGNFGSIDGDSAAAMRYTEARMTPLAMELLRDLEKDTVRWGLNFDDTLKEPDVLPGRFPNLLVNGASGIAVGVATNIPPHNLGEVIDGVVAYIDNPNITLDQMMKIIKGPDFPTGGELLFGDGLRAAYETGKGKITLRAKVGIEQSGDKQSLVITELPYQVNKAVLLQKIAELKEKNKDKLSVISEIRDESDRNGMRAVIRLKKEANAKKILGILYQSTNMQVSYAINMVAIAAGKPKLLSLMEIISYYTAFQRDVVVRRTKFDLNVTKDRAHIVEGLLIAIKNIDAVIKIIKTSANVSEAKQRLREKFGLSEKQAQAILDMRLARLVNLEVTKLQDELAALRARIKELEAILNSKKLQLEVVKKEILEIKRRFNTPRRSHEIKNEEITLTKMEEIEDVKDYLVALSAGKTLKKVNVKNYSKSLKTLNDNSTLFDIHTQIMAVKPTDTVLIFTDRGNCVKMTVDKLPECKWREKGITLKNIDKTIDIMETPVTILKVEGDGEVVFFTKNGMVKRSTLKDLVVSKIYYQAIKLADDDKLIAVEHEVKGKTFVMLSKHGNCVNFEKSEVPVQGRVSGGVKGINLDDKDSVVFAGQNLSDTYMVVTNNGYVKRLDAMQVPICARYRKGVKYINFDKTGKEVAYVGTKDKCVVDQGLKFTLLDRSKFKVSTDRLSVGQEEVKKKFLSIYDYIE
ncbi:MAG: DNA topoisomerase 4 subunit A [Clostridia bacterium]|nr:DNA topoisomerase 4 subunit A [Clostridia bacterium]